MPNTAPLLTTLSLLISVIPGAYAWWGGRGLIRRRDDPVLAERLMAYRARVGLLVLIAVVAVFVLASQRLAPRLIPLIGLAALTGVFPSRRALFGETWSFTAYLEHKLRFFLAFAGFRFLLMFTPLLVSLAREWRWQALGLLALLLFGWLFSGLSGFARLLGAGSLQDGEVQARLDAIAARSTAPRPLLLCLDCPGGRVANAFAIPALPRPAVLFTRTLLDELQPDEVEAIFAHELAHLEHMDARFMRRLTALACLAIVAALSGVPVLEAWFGPDSLGTAALLAIGAIPAIALVYFIGHGRHQETASDRRAVELCGDAEALVRGLVRLHGLNHMPRRWDLGTEGLSTHPSLANRIRAIRAAAGLSHEAIAEPIVLPAVEAGSHAILDSERVHWLDGVPADVPAEPSVMRERAAAVTTLAYGELRELLIRPQGARGAVLSAADRNGRQWKLTLRDEDIARAQAALAGIDGRVNQSVGGDRRQVLLIYLFCLGFLLTALGEVPFHELGLLAAVCVFRPRLYMLAAVALFALGEGIAAVFHGIPEGGQYLIQVVALLTLGPAAFVFALWSAGKVSMTRGKDLMWLSGLLILLALYGWLEIAIVMSDGAAPFHLQQTAQAYPETATALLALAGMAAVAGHRRRRAPIAGLLCVAAGVSLFLQSPYFAARYGNDPFAAEPDPLRWESLELPPVKEVALDQAAMELRLSPGGHFFAYRSLASDAVATAGRFVVADFEGGRADVVADDLAFVDEDRVLILAGTRDDKQVRLLARSGPSWTVQKQWSLEAVDGRRLAWNGRSGYWRVLGDAGDGGKLAMVSGALDADRPTIKQFPATRPGWRIDRRLAVGDELMSVPMLYAEGSGRPFREFWLSDGADWRKLAETAEPVVECLSSEPGAAAGPPVPCLVSGREDGSRVGLLDPASGRVDPLVQVADRFSGAVRQDGQLFLRTLDRHLLALDLAERRGITLQLPAVGDFITDMAAAGRWLGVLSYVHQQGSRMQLFENPQFRTGRP